MNAPVNPVIASLRAHRSVRRFTEEPVSDQQLDTILKTAQRASTSSNLQSYSVIVVRDRSRKEKLAALCGGQQQIIDCPVFLAHCADLNRAGMLCKQAGYRFEAEHLEYFLLGVIDATIFAQTALTAAEGLGLGGCMIGGARNQPFALAELLDLPPRVFVVFGMTLGHPQKENDSELKARLPLSGIVHTETYDSSNWPAAHDDYDRTMLDAGIYGRRRIDLSSAIDGWSDRTPEGAYGWSEHSARRLIDPGAQRKDLRPFLEQQGFRLQ